MIALTLSVPLEDWFTPCENAVTPRGVRANQPIELGDVVARRGRTRSRRPASTPRCLFAARIAAPKPLVCASRNSQSSASSRRRWSSSPLNSSTSVPGRIWQEQIGDVAGRRAARIDHHDAQLPVRCLRLHDALDTAPGGTTRVSSRRAR